MRINYLFKRLSLFFIMLLVAGFAYGQSVTGTYTAGSVACDYDGSATITDTASCPALLQVTVPTGAVITGTDIAYSVIAQSGAYMSEAASFVRCTSVGGVTEPTHYDGVGSTGGTYAYSRTGTNIANGVTGGGTVEFQMNLFRSWGGSSMNCDTTYQYIPSGSWTVTVHYFIPVPNDLSVMSIDAPSGAAIGFSNSEPVTISIKNFGTSAQSSYSVAYSADNGTTWVTEALTTNIPAGDTLVHTFATNADLSATGTHTILAATILTGDGNTFNDTNMTTVENLPLPYVYGFEGATDNAMPMYWSQINTSSSSYAYVYADVYSTYANTGTTYLRMYNSSGSSGDLMGITPRVVSGISGKVLKFYARANTSTRPLHIGVLTDPTDGSTFVPIDTFDLTNSHQQFAVDFSGYTGTGEYIAFKHPQTNTYTYYYIDDIEIYQPVPNDLMMLSWDAPGTGIDMTSESVTVSIYNNGTAAQSNFDVKYSVDGGTTIVTETVGTTLNAGDTLQYTFTTPVALTAGAYNDCGAVVSLTGDAVPANDTVFYQFNNFGLPYANDFESESDNQMPDGWSLINATSSTSSYAYADLSSSNSYNGSYMFKMYNSSGTSGDLIASMPVYKGTTLTDKWMKFMMKGSSSCNLIVGVMTDATDATTFVSVDTLPVPSSYAFQVVDFSAYAGAGEYVAFKHDLATTYDYIYIDDLVFEVAPTTPIYAQSADTLDFNPVRFNHADTTMRSVVVTNDGVGVLNVTGSAISGTNSANFVLADTNTYPKGLGIGESLTIKVKFGGSSVGMKTASLDITANTVVNNVVLNGEVIDPTIVSFPYVENFDDQAVDAGWELRSSSGNYNWQYDYNTTGSSSTGPASDVTGGYYIYTEASSPASAGDVASIYTNPVNLTSLTAPKLNYWYHMYGSNIDTLWVEAAYGGVWTLLDTINGEQHSSENDPWSFKSIDLSSFTMIDSIRFWTTRGSSYYGDVAIDNIAIGQDFTVDLGGDTTHCGPYTVDGGAPANGTWMYAWYDMADTSMIGSGQTIEIATSGRYALTAMDAGYFMGTDTINVTINPLPSVSFTGLGTVYCANDVPVTLTGSPVGGTFSGNGVALNTFDPSLAGAGNQAVTYTYTDVNNCTNDTTIMVLVNEIPMFDLGMDQAVCYGDSTMLEITLAGNDPFFSEYQEGSSNHKAVEIYNPTAMAIDMTEYAVLTNYNGNAWSGMYQFPAGTSLASGDVFVMANDQADATILAQADDTMAYNANGYMMGYNGDDVRALVKFAPNGDTIIVDIIGLYDLVDPGSGWDVAGVANGTQNHTLVRKPNAGPNYGNWAGSAGTDSLDSEWLVYPQNTWMYLGSHTYTVTPPTMTYSWSNGAATAMTYVTPMTTQYYTATVTNAATSCYAMDSVQVVVNALPVVNLGADADVCANLDITLDAGAFAAFMWNTMDATQTIVADSTGLGLGTHDYYVEVTDSNGCVGSDTIAITYLATPVVSITAPAQNKHSEDLVLDATAGFVTYLWSTGGTAAQETVPGGTLTAGQDNSFTVTVTDANGCEGMDSVTVFIIDDIGINDPSKDLNVEMYPNPSNGIFNIAIEGYQGKLVMETFTSNGQLIQREDLTVSPNYTNSFDVTGLATGVYYIKLTGENAAKTLKLIVQ